jgi:pimeloyl-ACP methyl ester carboxylesterase
MTHAASGSSTEPVDARDGSPGIGFEHDRFACAALRNAVRHIGAAPFVVVSANPGVGESVMRSRRRRWVYVELPGVGHVPQLQVPRQLADHVLAWMDDALPS